MTMNPPMVLGVKPSPDAPTRNKSRLQQRVESGEVTTVIYQPVTPWVGVYWAIPSKPKND